MLEFDEGNGPGHARIKVIGVGGGGGNAVNTMIEAGLEGVDFIVANTDCQVLETSQAPTRVQLGKALTKGLGAGANPEIGRAAALEDAARVAEALAGSDMVFVTAGMGGGTGTGAAPVIAQVARDLGALTVGVVTKPFMFEGAQRRKKAAAGIAELAKGVDALISIPNDRLISLAGQKMPFKDAFILVDSVLLNAVRGISDLVTVPGIVNVDFADVRAVMTGMGRALMGTGRGSGEKGAVEAAMQAINSPLLEDVSIDGATGVLINITGGPELTLAEINEACTLIEEAADTDANIIFGSVIDPNAGDEVRITVIATGFQSRTPAVHDSSPGRLPGKRDTDQMALPMRPPVAATLPAAARAPDPYRYAYAAQAVEQAVELTDVDRTPVPVPMPVAHTIVASPPPPVFGYPPPASAFPQHPPTVGYGAPAAQPPAGVVTGTLGEGSAPNDPRPIIRPPVTPAGALPRRSAGAVPVVRATDDLGVDESEFDKPTYLRRGLINNETIDR